MGANEDSSHRRMFHDGAAVVSLWLQSEGFEVATVCASRSRWCRIRFTVEFDEHRERCQQHAEWGREYLDGHEYVVRDGDNWTISEFVLLEELNLHPPAERCRLAGCSRESECWVVDHESGHTRQYCARHATLAAQTSVAENSEEYQYEAV